MEEYLQKSLLLLNIEQNELNTLYFSSTNISTIQNLLKHEAKKYTGYNISNQNCTDILIAMQYFYISYPQFTLGNDVRNDILSLNNLVVTDLNKQIVSGIKQHLSYLKNINTLPEPLEYGKSSGTKGQNSLEYQSMNLNGQSQESLTETNVDRYNEYQKMRTK